MYVCVCTYLPLPPYSRTMHPRETSINKMHHLLVSLITVQWSIVVSPFSRWSGALSSNLVLGAARHYKTNFLRESLDFILSQELENEYIIYITWNTLNYSIQYTNYEYVYTGICTTDLILRIRFNINHNLFQWKFWIVIVQ